MFYLFIIYYKVICHPATTWRNVNHDTNGFIPGGCVSLGHSTPLQIIKNFEFYELSSGSRARAKKKKNSQKFVCERISLFCRLTIRALKSNQRPWITAVGERSQSSNKRVLGGASAQVSANFTPLDAGATFHLVNIQPSVGSWPVLNLSIRT